jgi:hypothetical protein
MKTSQLMVETQSECTGFQYGGIEGKFQKFAGVLIRCVCVGKISKRIPCFHGGGTGKADQKRTFAENVEFLHEREISVEFCWQRLQNVEVVVQEGRG